MADSKPRVLHVIARSVNGQSLFDVWLALDSPSASDRRAHRHRPTSHIGRGMARTKTLRSQYGVRPLLPNVGLHHSAANEQGNGP